MNDNFVSLHNHSEGSFLDGFSTTDMISSRASELGQNAAALYGEV